MMPEEPAQSVFAPKQEKPVPIWRINSPWVVC